MYYAIIIYAWSYIMEKLKPKEKPHYVNNREFSYSVVEYVKSVQDAEAIGKSAPIVSDYIATCFLKIGEGLSHKANFIRYTYREEMVMDAVENCLKAIMNYNIEAATRTGNPNAFAYFTQICYFAFLRRIAKEKKQQDIKFRWIEKAGLEDFIQYANEGDYVNADMNGFIDELRGRIEKVRHVDRKIKEYGLSEKKEESGIELFMG
jgi:hypothetical protein